MSQTTIPAWAKGTLIEKIFNFKGGFTEIPEPIAEGEKFLGVMTKYQKTLLTLRDILFDDGQKETEMSSKVFKTRTEVQILQKMLSLSLRQSYPGILNIGMRSVFQVVSLNGEEGYIKDLDLGPDLVDEILNFTGDYSPIKDGHNTPENSEKILGELIDFEKICSTLFDRNADQLQKLQEEHQNETNHGLHNPDCVKIKHIKDKIDVLKQIMWGNIDARLETYNVSTGLTNDGKIIAKEERPNDEDEEVEGLMQALFGDGKMTVIKMGSF